MVTVILLLSLTGVVALGFLLHWAASRLLVRIAQRLAPAQQAAASPQIGNAMRVSGRRRSVVIWSGQGRKDEAS